MGRLSRNRALGFTLIDLLVLMAVIALFVGVLAPVCKGVRRGFGDENSFANLAVLNQAHAMYAADWDGRQVTWIPDDAGAYPTCQSYIGNVGCPPPFVLGFDSAEPPNQWGYYLTCHSGPGSCANWSTYGPMAFTPASAFGSFRLPNAKAFHDYVDGRFYSIFFYTSQDYRPQEIAKPGFSLPGEFELLPGPPALSIIYSSYCLSPAAMYDPAVLGYNAQTGNYFNAPNSFATGYQSPPADGATYPDLKSRMIEHNWCTDPPSLVNPAFAGGNTPWFFNHGAEATPVTLFFDGHVAELSTGAVAKEDQALLDSTGVGLWSRDTPLGSTGYFGAQSFDGIQVSHHILTIDGILGRDTLGRRR